jgi:hypothetical protein
MAISLDKLHERTIRPDIFSELRLLYPLFEEAQRSRVAHGERLRAIFQGRSGSALGGGAEDPDTLLKAIPRGERTGAPRVLEQAYSRAFQDEAEAAAALRESIEHHPAWPWLSNVKGVAHLLAARLLSRLDVARANTPSSFWAYCGLATIPGVAYRCSRCGLDVAYPIGYQSRATHCTRTGRQCSGELAVVGSEAETRVAPRRTLLGGRATYDAHARATCYLIGTSILRCGGEYRSFYDAERARLAADRKGWTPKRCHLSALRKMEKMFLRDLWIAWRRAVDLPIVPAYFPRIE